MSIPDGGSSSPPFGFGVRLGIALIVESACLSALAVVSLLLYIIYSAVVLKPGATRTWTGSTHTHYYFVNLLVFDLIQAIGGLLDIKWVIDAEVTEGTLCTVQGMLKQMGDVGVALSTLAIALHTFFVLIFRWHPAPCIAPTILVVIWIFIALIIGVSVATHKGKDYYGDTQYWCWITTSYDVQRIALEYFWLWLAAFINILCYVAMALVIKGFVLVDGARVRLRLRRSSVDATGDFSSSIQGQRVQPNAVALQMLFYPLIYVITVFPIAIVRWMAFGGKSIPFAATAFADILFALSGLFNVVLFTVTRPKLLPNRRSHSENPYYLRPYSFEVSTPQSFAGRLPVYSAGSVLAEERKRLSPMTPAHLPALYTGVSYSGPVHPLSSEQIVVI